MKKTVSEHNDNNVKIYLDFHESRFARSILNNNIIV